MEENKDIQFEGQHENNTKVQYNDQPKTKKKSNKGFIIGYIIFFIILIVVTVVASILTISYINKKRSENQGITIIDNNKKDAEDAEYGIKSFTETYNSNSLKIKELFDINGEIFEKFPEGDHLEFVHYIQIDGLKDKNIQNKINKQLKDVAYNIKDDNTYTIVKGNFANILSVEISNGSGSNGENDLKTLNFDLSTGEEIPFEKVFVSSATINSYLSDALYKLLAWDNAPQNQLSETTDMKDIDTSSFEDKFLILINNYNKAKESGNIRYSISPSGVNVYGLLDDRLISEESVKYLNLKIDFTNCKEEVAIYKRYLTSKSIFSDDSIGYKNTIVFTNSYVIEQYFDRIYYGKVKDNLFVEEIMYKNNEEESKEEGYESALEYVKKLSEDNREDINKNAFDNKGTIYQREYWIWYDKRGFFRITVSTNKVTCPVIHFEEAFRAYIDAANVPTADISPNFINYVDKDKYPNLKLEDSDWEEYYLDKDGKLIGRTEEEATRSSNINNEYNVNNEIVENTIGNMVTNSAAATTGNAISNSTINATGNSIINAMSDE